MKASVVSGTALLISSLCVSQQTGQMKDFSKAWQDPSINEVNRMPSCRNRVSTFYIRPVQ